MKALSEYDISKDQGYLCQFNAGDIVLTGDFATARKVAMDLPKTLPSGRVRTLLETALPANINADAIATLTDPQARAAMVHYSFMVQAYVWGEPDVPTTLPHCLAVPIVALADRLGQQPLLPYSGYVLDNWAKIDPARGIDLDNIYMIQPFLGGQDEAWFVLIHVAIEATAGQALALMPEIISAVSANDTSKVEAHLKDVISVWGRINAIFDRMPERCDPYVYFHRVRPYIHGWRDNPALPDGLIYEGVKAYGTQGQAFRGQTGSQSSIVPAMDALMGVGHAKDPLKTYLDELHIYRPPAHRAFIDDVRAESRLREFVKTSNAPELVKHYNGVIQAVADFRTRHLEYAASYIHKQSKGGAGNDSDVGTGGTPFMKYLKKHRDETEANLIQP